MKNVRIRTAMAKAGINQGELAILLGVSDSEIRVVLNKYDLTKSEQDRIIDSIRNRDVDTA